MHAKILQDFLNIFFWISLPWENCRGKALHDGRREGMKDRKINAKLGNFYFCVELFKIHQVYFQVRMSEITFGERSCSQL